RSISAAVAPAALAVHVAGLVVASRAAARPAHVVAGQRLAGIISRERRELVDAVVLAVGHVQAAVGAYFEGRTAAQPIFHDLAIHPRRQLAEVADAAVVLE